MRMNVSCNTAVGHAPVLGKPFNICLRINVDDQDEYERTASVRVSGSDVRVAGFREVCGYANHVVSIMMSKGLNVGEDQIKLSNRISGEIRSYLRACKLIN